VVAFGVQREVQRVVQWWAQSLAMLEKEPRQVP